MTQALVMTVYEFQPDYAKAVNIQFPGLEEKKVAERQQCASELNTIVRQS